MSIICYGQGIEPIATAPRDGRPVWAQIADIPTEEIMAKIGIEPTERKVRRAWIYWAEPGLEGCNLGGHWTIASPDFQVRRYNFFIDGWFPSFTPGFNA